MSADKDEMDDMSDLRLDWGTHLGARADARMAAQPGAEQVRLVESLPGDVVLSREDAERLCELAHTLRQDARTLLLSLLRGGR